MFFKANNYQLAVLLLLVTVLPSCETNFHDNSHDHSTSHEHADSAPIVKGPQGGRLLTKDRFSLELKIFETGVPPRFRVYAYDNNKPISPNEFTTSVTLTRISGFEADSNSNQTKVEVFELLPEFEYLTSEKEVIEPHSFDVKINAKYKNLDFEFSYPSYEGRTIIREKIAAESGIETELATSRNIKSTIEIRGKITPSEHNIAHIIPRFPGVVREGRKHIGDSVQKGEVLAIVESNQSLQPFEIRSPIAGTVLNGHLIFGEYVSENQLVYIVGDLSVVWADFILPIVYKNKVTIGQNISIKSEEKNANLSNISATISYLSPYADEQTQSVIARAIIDNKNKLFPPGMFVTANLVLDEISSEVSVLKYAVQTFNDKKVVFIKSGDIYEIRPVILGLSDSEYVQIESGISKGVRYVSKNSFLIKADILKSEASHDH